MKGLLEHFGIDAPKILAALDAADADETSPNTGGTDE